MCLKAPSSLLEDLDLPPQDRALQRSAPLVPALHQLVLVLVGEELVVGHPGADQLPLRILCASGREVLPGLAQRLLGWRQPFFETVDGIFYLGRRDGIVCLRAPGGSAAVAPSGAVAAGAEVDHGEQHDHADGGKLHEARRAARAPDDEHRHEDERDARPPGGPVR